MQMSNTKVLALGNQKGGVSKTTSSLNLCYALANTYGMKVLLIDMDSQGSAGLNLGIDIADDDVYTIDAILEPYVERKIRSISWEALKQCIYTPTFTDRVRDPENKLRWKDVQKPFGFDIIPSSLYLSVVELEMGIRGGITKAGIYQYYLRDAIDVIKANADYDFIIIDTPPSLGALSINSMAAAVDGIIVVTNLDMMSMRGIDSFIESSKTVQRMNPNHRGILGILMALYSERRTVDKSVEDWAKNYFPIRPFKTRIPESADVKKANSSMLLFAQINKKAKAAFDNLAREIIYAVENPNAIVGESLPEDEDKQ